MKGEYAVGLLLGQKWRSSGELMAILPPEGSRGFFLGILLALAGVIVALLWPLLPVGAPFGYRDARRDLAEGHLRIKAGMVDFGWKKEWRRLAWERYGIEVGGGVLGCFVGGFSGSYENAYNKVQREEIIRRFGRDVVRETMMKAINSR